MPATCRAEKSRRKSPCRSRNDRATRTLLGSPANCRSSAVAIRPAATARGIVQRKGWRGPVGGARFARVSAREWMVADRGGDADGASSSRAIGSKGSAECVLSRRWRSAVAASTWSVATAAATCVSAPVVHAPAGCSACRAARPASSSRHHKHAGRSLPAPPPRAGCQAGGPFRVSKRGARRVAPHRGPYRPTDEGFATQRCFLGWWWTHLGSNQGPAD